MKRILLISFLIGIFATIEVSKTNAQNSTGWRGDFGNGTIDGFNTPDEWPDELKKDWQIKVGEGDASPVLLNDKIYVFVKVDDKETVICLEAENGEEVWRTSINASPEITGPAAGHPGPRSTPFVTDFKVYTLGAGGVLACLNSETGKVIWKNDKYTDVPQFYTSCSPLVVNDICVVQLGGKDNGIVAAFNAETGAEMWKMEGVPCTYSSPSLMETFDDVLLVQSETDLLGVTFQGELLWKIATPVERRSYNAPTPVYEGQTVIVAGQGSGTHAFNIVKKGSSWETKELWNNTEMGTSFCTPVIKNGFVFANDGRLGKLFCINASTGENCWMDETTLNRFASILDLGEVLVSLPANGKLIVFEPNGKSYNEVAEYQVADSEVYAHPVFADNNIVVKDKEMLTCWKVE